MEIHLSIWLGKILTEALEKKLEKERELEPDLTVSQFIKRTLWKGLKK